MIDGGPHHVGSTFFKRGRRWRAGVAGATVSLMVLLAAFAGAPAQAQPVDMANQQYSETTRDGWHLNLSIEHERVNSVPNLAAALNSREGFMTLSATATATGGSAPITDSLFIAGSSWAANPTSPAALGSAALRRRTRRWAFRQASTSAAA